ncbi:hypothetical protein [Aliivibrio fischeri]|uniref:hypothetical protein n=1 Tax=Aliivibrio fischeri TaxID=668 RepID=UPI00090811EB|nr:hypothetical protein [Aliivibrio fischeri]
MDKKIENIMGFISEFKPRFEEKINCEIKDWEQIKELISFYIDNDEGSPIVDFIDLSNWDSVESYTFDDESRTLELVWHDFQTNDPDGMRDYFGVDLIKCDIKVESVVITINKSMPVLLLKGFYQAARDINLTYNNKCSGINISSNHPFSTEINRTVKRKHQSIVVPNINCFTMSIIPNCARYISADESKTLLYKFNIDIVQERLLALITELNSVDDADQETLQVKGNIARKCFENALKVLNLKSRVEFDKDYQRLMLGDLTGILKNLEFSDAVDFKLPNVLDTLNTCSHDSGVFINKEHVFKSILFIVAAINLN